MVNLSKRMQGVANLMTPGLTMADIGTDHGYIPIYMVTEKNCPHAIAMDVNQGPLERAREHITQYGLEAYIETRLSDGLSGLSEGEVRSILIAGMGGGLICRILEEGFEKQKGIEELILQPQSEIEEVRKFLRMRGLCIVQEDMILEDGKYYPMMKVVPGMAQESEKLVIDRYGPCLLTEKNSVLASYLHKERKILLSILEKLEKGTNQPRNQERFMQIKDELACNFEALTLMKEEIE